MRELTRTERILALYSGVPKAVIEDVNSVTDAKAKRFSKELGEYRLMLTNNLVLPFVAELNKKDSDFLYLDFTEYFDGRVGQTESSKELKIPKDTLIIYNVGLEGALNKTYSAQLLKGLIAKAHQNGANAVIVFPYGTVGEFKRYYSGIEAPFMR